MHKQTVLLGGGAVSAVAKLTELEHWGTLVARLKMQS